MCEYIYSFRDDLVEIPYINGITELCIHNCKNLTFIPALPKLEILSIYNCPLITTIPSITTLHELYISNCPKISVIPEMENIFLFFCIKCPSLSNVYLSAIQVHISDCVLLEHINTDEHLTRFSYNNCPFIKQNSDHLYNYKSLIKIQRWIKRQILHKKIRLLQNNEDFISSWYHPKSHGGWFSMFPINERLLIKSLYP